MCVCCCVGDLVVAEAICGRGNCSVACPKRNFPFFFLLIVILASIERDAIPALVSRNDRIFNDSL